MDSESVWNHPFDLLPQVNSKWFFSFDVIVCILCRNLTLPHQYLFDGKWKEGPSGSGLGFYFFGWLFLCVRVRAYVDFRMDLQVPESSWSP